MTKETKYSVMIQLDNIFNTFDQIKYKLSSRLFHKFGIQLYSYFSNIKVLFNYWQINGFLDFVGDFFLKITNEYINVVLRTWIQTMLSTLRLWNDSNFYIMHRYNDTLEMRLLACMAEDTKKFIEDLHATMVHELKNT